MEQDNKTVGIVGAGVIGLSWAALYASHGHQVHIFDIREDIEDLSKGTLDHFFTQVPNKNVIDKDEFFKNIIFFSSLKDAFLVQENGPEKAEFKQKMFAELESYVSENCILISSSSGIIPEVIGAKMKNPMRALIGHPFNPPHIIPLVEVCVSTNASDDLVNRAMDFYKSLNKRPVRLNKPIAGFVANRLQTVILNESINIVKKGIVDVKGLDDIMTSSLGIRYASIGPFLTGQLGGGDGGITHIVQHIISSLMTSMDMETIDEETLAMVAKQTEKYYPLSKKEEFEEIRDKTLLSIIKNRNLVEL
jgi:ketoreductase RED1